MSIGGCKAELGANFVHGILGNPLYELAASNGLVELGKPPKAHNVAATTEDGRRVPFAILQEIYEAYYWFFKRCEEYFLSKYEVSLVWSHINFWYYWVSQTNSWVFVCFCDSCLTIINNFLFQPPENVKSVGEHIELEISIFLQRYPPQQRQLRRLIFDYLLKRECCITGCDTMDDIDLIGIGSYTELPGGNVELPNGYVSMLKPLIKSLPANCIVKECPVKTIHWKYRVEQEEQDSNSSDNDSVCSVIAVSPNANSSTLNM